MLFKKKYISIPYKPRQYLIDSNKSLVSRLMVIFEKIEVWLQQAITFTKIIENMHIFCSMNSRFQYT